MLSDIEIAQACEMLPITEVADRLGIENKDLEQYGRYKAKVDLSLLDEHAEHEGKLILVTAITPTPAGEGKTTTAIGLADGLRRIGKNAVIAMREPSLGPVFGIKGGACGGGRAQVVPMEDINLHFTGDFHAIGIANNLMSALIDNHIQQGNALDIDVRNIPWKRVVDMNDRQLRHIVCGLGGKASGVPREDGFDIVVASEIMAVLCLATDLADMKARLAKMVVAYCKRKGSLTLAQHGESGFDRDRIQLIANELASDLRTIDVDCASIIAIQRPMHASTVSALYDCVYDFAFFAYTTDHPALMYHLSEHDSCSVELRATLFSNDEEDLSQTPAAHELEVALQGRNVAYRLEGEAGQLRMIVLMPRAGE